MDIEVTVKDDSGTVIFSELVAGIPKEELILPGYATIGMQAVAQALAKRYQDGRGVKYITP